MIFSLKKLIQEIQKKYDIGKNEILAHSDIAPFRKKDPGNNFPWKSLNLSKITLNFQKIKKRDIKKLEQWFVKNNLKTQKKIIIFILSLIGYDTRNVNINYKLYNKLIKAYAIRYLNDKNKVTNKLIYNTLLIHLFNFLLTKN